MDKFSCGDRPREYIFSRNVSVQIVKQDSETVVVNGLMIDSYHELSVRLLVDMCNVEIKEAGGEFIRAPHKTCIYHAENLFSKLVGLTLGPGVSMRLARAIKPDEGCTHITNLVLECAKAIIECMMAFYPNEIASERLEAIQGGKCHYFANRNKTCNEAT